MKIDIKKKVEDQLFEMRRFGMSKAKVKENRADLTNAAEQEREGFHRDGPIFIYFGKNESETLTFGPLANGKPDQIAAIRTIYDGHMTAEHFPTAPWTVYTGDHRQRFALIGDSLFMGHALPSNAKIVRSSNSGPDRAVTYQMSKGMAGDQETDVVYRANVPVSGTSYIINSDHKRVIRAEYLTQAKDLPEGFCLKLTRFFGTNHPATIEMFKLLSRKLFAMPPISSRVSKGEWISDFRLGEKSGAYYKWKNHWPSLAELDNRIARDNTVPPKSSPNMMLIGIGITLVGLFWAIKPKKRIQAFENREGNPVVSNLQPPLS